MRKLLLILFSTLTLSAEQMYLYEVSPIFGFIANGAYQGKDSSYAYGLEFQYNDVDFFIKPELTYIYSPNIDVYNTDATASSHYLMVNGVYDLEYTALLTPFLKAGIGYGSTRGPSSVTKSGFLGDAGAGLKFNIRDQFALKFEALAVFDGSSEDNIIIVGGLDFAFGNEANTPVAKHVTPEPIEVKTVQKQPEEVVISKDDYNLIPTPQYKNDVVRRNADGSLHSITLFIPFPFRSDTIDEHSKESLRLYAQELKRATASMLIIGYTDSRGRRSFNTELSLKRADVVKEVLVNAGVSAAHITTQGRGEENPIADNATEEGRATNRRIEIIVESDGK